MSVVTEYIRPPVPSTAYDWMAYLKADEGEEQRPTGYGPTELEAVKSLCEALAMDLDEAYARIAQLRDEVADAETNLRRAIPI